MSTMDTGAQRHAPALLQYMEPLSELLDGDVTEVCVNRPGEAWTESRGEWQRHQIGLERLSFKHCMHLANLIANFNKLRVGVDEPYLSGSLPNRERVQIVVPPAVTEETVSITIRKPSEVDFTLEELEAQGSFEAVKTDGGQLRDVDKQLLQLKQAGRIREFLELAVVEKKNILIAGSTGSGKTTVMKSLARCIPHGERVITIEDSHEMFMNGFPNKVHLFYKGADETAKATSQAAIKSCLRMKPDRILLAELRGQEVWDYLDSLNSGHPGSLSSIHANSALDAFNRLTSLVKMSNAGQNLQPEYIQQMCFEAIDIVLFYERKRMKELYYDPERKQDSARVELRAA